MSLQRVISACLLAVVATLAIGVGAAVAGPREVFADWWADGDLDAAYSLPELRGALDLPGLRGGSYDAFPDIVNSEITRLVAGGSDGTPGSSSRSASPDKGAAPRDKPGDPNPADENSNTTPSDAPIGGPAPPAAVAQDDNLPAAFIALAVVAGLLVVVGGGTAVARRFRRR